MLRYIVVFRVILPRANARLLGFEVQNVRMRFFSWEKCKVYDHGYNRVPTSRLGTGTAKMDR